MSGGSAFGTHLPAAWRRRGWLGGDHGDPLEGFNKAPGRGRLAVAGSCSDATARQNAWIEAQGATVHVIDAADFLESGTAPAAERLAAGLAEGRTVLVRTDSTPAAMERSRAWAGARNLSAQQLGLQLAGGIAALIARVVALQPPEAIVSAGGESSSALCRALGIRALAIGRNIQPGVPLCIPISGRPTPLVLKSGNFGSEDFYQAAFDVAARLS